MQTLDCDKNKESWLSTRAPQNHSIQVYLLETQIIPLNTKNSWFILPQFLSKPNFALFDALLHPSSTFSGFLFKHRPPSAEAATSTFQDQMCLNLPHA